eukprot:CAMPEP_0172929970 /NCGR_PEP_ID=MMETSP1075-20121228/218754_1 /TAXON_ID=2916 /ORGANISM="Ceratium fusus, Strain PA161109" /LENGTH=271 /DNA_ID=CAMNT_0013791277 /DNA_START=721 /DNA_END=1536 /DNA_ORIENTATION=-
MYTQGGANQKVFHMKRDATCTCCCFNRPVVEIMDVTSNQIFGSISDPFACCNLTFDVKDHTDQEVLAANGGCCQWGLCCPLPCGPCAEVNFDLNDPSGQGVGKLKKKVPNCFKFFLAPDVDNFNVDFGGVSHPQYKALVMALAIFMDFRYVKDHTENEVLKANGGCCQWGLCCPLPCGPCAEVNFELNDPNGQGVGKLQKKVPNCCKFFMAPDVDNFNVEFGGVSHPQYKALVMALAIFMDFRYFNENPNDDEGGVLGAMAGDGDGDGDGF